MWVLEASVALAWCFADERTPAVNALEDRLRAEPAIVPQHWRREVASGLVSALRRSRPRLTLADRDGVLRALSALPIEVDEQTQLHAWQRTLALADQYGLTPYDAAYLELATRLGCELASLDGDLRAAATAAGVGVLPALA
jgi:predicted nucleic acid-binding protein